MRLIEKLAYNAIKVATLASIAGVVMGTATLVFANGTLLDLQERKETILEEYIDSPAYYTNYTSYKNQLDQKVRAGLISIGESVSQINEYTSKENIEEQLLSSNSLIGKSYQKATEDYEAEKKSLLTKTLTGLSCGIPAFAGCVALDKINEKLDKKKDEENSSTLSK